MPTVTLANAGEFYFEIPYQSANTALNKYARVTGRNMLFQYDRLGEYHTNEVIGKYHADEALRLLLLNTGLAFTTSDLDNIIISTTAEVRGKSMKKKKGFLTSVSLFLLSVFSTPQGAVAQEPRVAALEEIIVTARKRTESLQTAPVAITAMDAEAIKQRDITNIMNLESFIPNLSIGGASAAGTTASSFYIRGVGQERNSIVAESAVALYVDGVFIGRSEGSLLGILDLDRIEVLRGPQGTLFGKNTLGGAINLVSAKPDEELSGSVALTLGEFNRRDINGTVNIPLSDNLFFKVSAATTERDGHVERLSDGIVTGDINSDAIRAQLLWDASDSVSVNFAVDSTDISTNGPSSVLLGVNPGGIASLSIDPETGFPFDERYLTGDFYTTWGGAPTFNNYDGLGSSMVVDWDINGDLAFKSISSYRTHDAEIGIDIDATPHGLFDQQLFREHEQYSQEFQLLGTSLDSKLEWVTGVFYFFENPVEDRRVVQTRDTAGNGPGGRDRSNLNILDQETTSYALFGQATYDLTDKLSTTFGLRWSTEEKDFLSIRTESDGTTLQGINNDTWDNVAPRVGLEYQWTNDVMTYISWARGFKSGGLNDRIRGNLPNNGILPYDEEILDSIELGLRSELLDGRLRFNATVFDSTYEDLQLASIPPGQSSPLVQNIGGADMRGLEIEGLAVVTDNFIINFAFAYLDSEYTDVTGAVGYAIDSDLARAPETSYSIGGQYEIDLSGGGLIQARVDWGWKDEYRISASDPNAIYQDAFGLLSANLTYTGPSQNWGVSVFGTNLNDEEYVVSGFNGGDFLGFVHGEPGRPREVGVLVSVDF